MKMYEYRTISYPIFDPAPSLVTWVLLVVGGPGTGGEQALPERISLGSGGSSDILDTYTDTGRLIFTLFCQYLNCLVYIYYI